MCPHKDLRMNAYSSSIHHSPKVETTQMSISGECINKMRSVCTMEHYSTRQESEGLAGTCYSTAELQKHHVKGKKPDLKDHMLFELRGL